MSLHSQQERPSKIAFQTQEFMARPFDKYLSLTGPKPAGSARSRRATFPSVAAETESRTMAPLTALAQDASQGGDQVVKKDEIQPTSEPKQKTLSRRATFPSMARSESPTMTPSSAPVANTSQDSEQLDKKNEPQYKGEPIHEILPHLYLGEYVLPTLLYVPNNTLTKTP